MAAAPVTSHLLVEDLKVGMLQKGIAGAGQISGEGSPTQNEGRKFMNFGSWFNQMGQQEIQDSARYINGFDPDIVTFHLPIQTKVTWQRNRNYNRILKEKQSWFASTLRRNGWVKDWG